MLVLLTTKRLWKSNRKIKYGNGNLRKISVELNKPKHPLQFKEENHCFKNVLNLRCFVNTT